MPHPGCVWRWASLRVGRGVAAFDFLFMALMAFTIGVRRRPMAQTLAW